MRVFPAEQSGIDYRSDRVTEEKPLNWVLPDNMELRQMIRKLTSGQFRLYSRKKNPKTGKRRNLGTFNSRAAAEKHERAVQYFKRH
jgi:hypothetical protein